MLFKLTQRKKNSYFMFLDYSKRQELEWTAITHVQPIVPQMSWAGILD